MKGRFNPSAPVDHGVDCFRRATSLPRTMLRERKLLCKWDELSALAWHAPVAEYVNPTRRGGYKRYFRGSRNELFIIKLFKPATGKSA
jgi:hypothetical protein